MTRRRLPVIAMVLFLTPACRSELPSLPPPPEESEPGAVQTDFDVANPGQTKYCQVIRRAANFIGELVRISGTVVKDREGLYLTDASCDAERIAVLGLPKRMRESSRSSTLQAFEAFAEARELGRSRRVKVVGMLGRGDSVQDLGPFPYVITVVAVEAVE